MDHSVAPARSQVVPESFSRLERDGGDDADGLEMTLHFVGGEVAEVRNLFDCRDVGSWVWGSVASVCTPLHAYHAPFVIVVYLNRSSICSFLVPRQSSVFPRRVF